MPVAQTLCDEGSARPFLAISSSAVPILLQRRNQGRVPMETFREDLCPWVP